ncbi:hypothetical protein PUN28_006224 [Cardiocondyla obscurior]|uniref:Uncharacterized protein n=1 Tax=Cardiocondyla obscurior TaxID=286306 RepID=A0AAW2GBC2_9HYME
MVGRRTRAITIDSTRVLRSGINSLRVTESTYKVSQCMWRSIRYSTNCKIVRTVRGSPVVSPLPSVFN